ncbi:MAG: SBBP repeat-containing protein, partial [Gemmatimonadota bacterium]|nr:SBBP repeat-containing protein [Gemmatimonadota bacterium]
GGGGGGGGGGGTPPHITLATYYGGSDDEMIRDVAVDNAGSVYLVGGSRSPNFPVTIGSPQGDYDVVVVKLSASGQLIWSRRFGGSGYDRAYGVEIDNQGQVVLGGRASTGFPVTAGAFQTAFAGGTAPGANPYGEQDGFVCKLNSTTAATIWCSYLGATDGGAVRDIDVDGNGNVFAASWVSADYPATWFQPNAYQPDRAGGQDLSLTRVSADGSQVLNCTYLGGSLLDGDGPSVRALPNGDAAFVMTTRSTDVPTVQPAQPGYQGGLQDLYVGVMSADGSTLRWGTYLGGNGNDNTETHDLAVDSHGNVIVAASTSSGDLPLVGPALRSGLGGGSDGFFARYSPTGTMLNSTYYGGAGGDSFQGVTVGPGDTVYVSGSTTSTSIPGVAGAAGGGGSDAYTVRVSADFSQDFGGVRLGGSQDDEGRSVARGPSGTWYVAGITRSSDFHTVNAAGASFGGGSEDGIFVIIAP